MCSPEHDYKPHPRHNKKSRKSYALPTTAAQPHCDEGLGAILALAGIRLENVLSRPLLRSPALTKDYAPDTCHNKKTNRKYDLSTTAAQPHCDQGLCARHVPQ